MKTIGMGAVLGIVCAGILAYFVNITDGASVTLIVVLSVAICTTALNIFKRRPDNIRKTDEPHS